MHKVLKLFDGEIVKEKYAMSYKGDISYAYVAAKSSRGFYSWVIGHDLLRRGIKKLSVSIKSPDGELMMKEFWIGVKGTPLE